jgi:hypothetical protein
MRRHQFFLLVLLRTIGGAVYDSTADEKVAQRGAGYISLISGYVLALLLLPSKA